MSEEKVELRKKPQIKDSLPNILKESDKKHVNRLFASYGNIIRNGYPSEDNPATYVGWLKLEDGTIIRLEGENRDGGKGLALKGVTIPHNEAVELGLCDPKIPGYKSEQTKEFLS